MMSSFRSRKDYARKPAFLNHIRGRHRDASISATGTLPSNRSNAEDNGLLGIQAIVLRTFLAQKFAPPHLDHGMNLNHLCLVILCVASWPALARRDYSLPPTPTRTYSRSSSYPGHLLSSIRRI